MHLYDNFKTYLGQVLTFVVQQVPFELISFLNKADGYNIRAVLGLFSDVTLFFFLKPVFQAVTQDLFLWYWSSYFPSEVIVFDKVEFALHKHVSRDVQ